MHITHMDSQDAVSISMSLSFNMSVSRVVNVGSLAVDASKLALVNVSTQAKI